MKNLFSFVALVCTLLTSNVLFAQKDAQANLNVRLYPIQTIEISGEKSINLDYVTKENYASGVTKSMNDHLTVYSTGGFAVKVKSESDNLTYAKGKDKHEIDLNTITINASKGTSNDLAEAEFAPVTLSKEYKDLITSTVGGSKLNFNVDYQGQGSNNYINKYYSVESPNVYNTTITYTIEAQ